MVLNKFLIILSLFNTVEPETKNENYPAIPDAIKKPMYMSRKTIPGNRDISNISQGIIKCNGEEEVCLIIHNNGTIELPAINGGSQFIQTNGYELLEDGIIFW